MIRFTRGLFFLALISLAVGCAPKQTTGPATTSGDLSNQNAELDGFGEHGPITEAELQTLRENFARVHFDFDKAELAQPSRDVLSANADILIRHPDVKVRVEGHADHYGSDIYNLALGQRRADAVKRYLTDLGVGTSQLDSISYGEERPLVAEAATKDKEVLNRRAEFLVIVGGESVESSY